MHKLLFGFTLLFVSLSSGAFAQHGGTDQEQKACARDVSRFCRKMMDQGDFVILACLQQNRPRLTAACRQVLTDHGQ
jgi:hypothetical protein